MFNQTIRFFYLSILLIVTSSAVSASNILSEGDPLSLFRYIHDNNKELNIQSALLRFQQGKSKTLSAKAFNIGNSDDVFWIAISVFNDTNKIKKRRLVFGTPFVPLLNAYLITAQGNSTTLMQHNGHQSFKQRINNQVKLNSLSFDLPAQQRVQLLIKYQPRGISFLPISLKQDSILFNNVHFESLQAAIFYSFSLTVILTFFFFGLAMRSHTVLFYAILFFEYVFFLSIIEGYAFKYLWPNWPQWNLYAGLVIALIFSASGFFMSSVAVEKTTLVNYFKPFCRGMTAISLLLLLLIPFRGNVVMMTINHILMILMLTSQGYCIFSWMSISSKRNSLAFYSALIVTGLAFYIFKVFLDSATLSEWMLISFNRILYLFVSLTTMGTFAIHLGGLRNDHQQSLQKALENAQRDAELNRALFESEQKYSQARELASKRKQQLAAASHDIRQPLLSLRSSIDILAQEHSPVIKQQYNDALNYLEELCGHFLSATRPETAKQENISFYPVSMITETVCKMFLQEAFNKKLVLHSVPCSVEISCTPTLLIRILSNFVANAIKHCEQGKIVIGCRRLPQHLKIDVYDQGSGIPPQTLETIFHPYNKGESSKGEGLGLSIVKEIVDKEGWQLMTKSQLGKGSCFSVIIPTKK